MRPVLGKILPWVFGTLMLFVIASAVRIGTVDLLFRYATDRMAAWPAVGPDAAQLVGVSRVLDAAHRVAPDNPDVYEAQARIEMLRAGMRDAGNAERNAELRNGVELVRRAIELRPVSPYGWAILLQLKNALGEHDAEFRHSLERTATLGPWEPELQVVIADVGLGAWAALPLMERKLVGEDIRRGMKRQPGAMFAIAHAHLDVCSSGDGTAGCVP